MRLNRHLIMWLALFLGSQVPAQAAGVAHWIPGWNIPDTNVMALDLPDTPQFQRSDGRYFDLGYLHLKQGGGKWVGYLGRMDSYVPITNDQLTAFLRAANNDQLPPIPARPTTPGNYLMYLIIALIGFGFSLKRWRKS